MGEGGQPGDVAPKDAAEFDGLGLAQNGELPGSIDDRAVVLAKLHGDITERLDISRIPGATQRGRHILRGDRATESAHGVSEVTGSIGCEGLDGLCSVFRSHESQGSQRQIVVGLVAGGPASRGEHEDTARPAPPARGSRAVRGSVVGYDQTLVHQGRQLSPDARGGHLKGRRQIGGRGRPNLHERARDALGGLSGEFHNDIVA